MCGGEQNLKLIKSLFNGIRNNNIHHLHYYILSKWVLYNKYPFSVKVIHLASW